MSVLRWLVREYVVIAVILLNAVALFMLATAQAESEWPTLWFAIDYACVVFFVVEAVIKISLGGRRAYFLDRWNVFDFIVVLSTVPFLASPFVGFNEFAGITVLRLLRLFRMFRLLRFIPDRDKIAAGIIRSLRASIGVFLGVTVVNFILAMGATMLFGDLAPEYFGDPLTACYSMFQVFTIEGWNEIPALIAERAESHYWAGFGRLYFVGSVFAGGIIGLSLANAVFVDQMVSDNNDQVEVELAKLTEEVAQLRALLTERTAGS